MQSDPQINRALALLGLKEGATEEEVKRAFRKYVKIHHPDRYSGDAHSQQLAAERFRQINQAYELIKGHLAVSGRSLHDSGFPVTGKSPLVAKPENKPSPAAGRADEKRSTVFSGGFRQALARFISNAVGSTPAAFETKTPAGPDGPQKSTGPVRPSTPSYQTTQAPKTVHNRRKSARNRPIGPIRPIAPVKRVDQV